MRYVDMHKLGHNGCHQCAPKAWHKVPNLTGDYDLDASIGHSPNKDMGKRLNQYITRQRYGYHTGYDTYGIGDD